MEAAMLAEIFMMRLEAAARAASVPLETLVSSNSVFVPFDGARQVALKDNAKRAPKRELSTKPDRGAPQV
jgi:hypothetical protein